MERSEFLALEGGSYDVEDPLAGSVIALTLAVGWPIAIADADFVSAVPAWEIDELEHELLQFFVLGERPSAVEVAIAESNLLLESAGPAIGDRFRGSTLGVIAPFVHWRMVHAPV